MSLVYDPTDFQRSLWRYHKLENGTAQETENIGRQTYEAFPEFGDEIFHRMYADEPRKLESPAEGTEPYQKMHELMDGIPEIQDLRERCVGDEHWAGIGAQCVLDTILQNVQCEYVDDVRGDEEVVKYLEKLLASSDGDDEDLEDLLREQSEILNKKKADAKQAAQIMDETQIRQAYRKAAKLANEEIERVEQVMDAVSIGIDPHSGKKARIGVHKKLAKVISNNDRLRKIAEMAGRLKRIARERQRGKPRRGTNEYAGIEQGGILERMTPSEMLFASEDLELVFAKKLFERSLVQFEIRQQEKLEQGPIVMLIDSSGSMKINEADIWAAAVCLAFADIAFMQKRPFAIIHFGTNVLRTDIFEKVGEDRERFFESVTFFASDGGTNFMSPLNDAIKLIKKQRSLNDADIVMITDGCANVTDRFAAEFCKDRNNIDCSCYSILVGSSTNKDVNALFSDEVVHLGSVLAGDDGMHKFFGEV